MRKVIVSLMAVIVPLVVCAEVLVDYSAGRSPAIGPAKIETSGTNTVLTVNSVSATNATVTSINGVTTLSATTVNATTVSASGKTTTYGYPAVAGHTNGSAQVYLMQSGSVVGNGSTTRTQAFDVAYIAAPNVVAISSTAASATNGLVMSTISSNQFLVITDTVATNFQWIAYGRIK